MYVNVLQNEKSLAISLTFSQWHILGATITAKMVIYHIMHSIFETIHPPPLPIAIAIMPCQRSHKRKFAANNYVVLGKFKSNYETSSVNTFWSTFSYNVEKINVSYGVNHCTLISFVSIFSKIGDPCMHFLKMIILKGELMRFIIYDDNVQQYMGALQRTFVKLHKA